MAQSNNVKNIRAVASQQVEAENVVSPAQDEAPISAPANDTATAAMPARKRSRRPFIFAGIGLIALAAGAWYGSDYFFNGRFIVSTDDAYVGGDIATISPKLGGYVATVNVVANQAVKKGDALVTLDDGDYVIARDSAQAQIDTANLTLKRIDAQIAGGEATLAQANAQKLSASAAQKNAALAQQRAASLASTNNASQAQLDQANAALDQANAQLAASDAQIAVATANIAVLKGQRAESESQLKTLVLSRDKAERDLGFTVIRAPFDGVVGNLAVQDGDLVSTSEAR